jgi:hypothetical protein
MKGFRESPKARDAMWANRFRRIHPPEITVLGLPTVSGTLRSLTMRHVQMPRR